MKPKGRVMDKVDAKQIEIGYQEAQKLLKQNQHVEAARAFAALMPALREAEDTLGQSRVLTHLAQIFALLDQIEQALEFYREAKRLAAEAGDQELLAITAHQLGCLLKSEEPLEAKDAFEQSRQACQVLCDARGESLSLAMIGVIEFEEGECETGMRHLLRALREMPEIEEREEVLQQVVQCGRQLPQELFANLVNEQIPAKALQQRLLLEGA